MRSTIAVITTLVLLPVISVNATFGGWHGWDRWGKHFDWRRHFSDCRTRGCHGGQVCAGPDHDRKCVNPMREGENCGQDPYWVCANGLNCEGGVCKSPVVHDCSTTGCDAGKKCAGAAGALLCVTPMKENDNCGQDPYWVCADGLNCEGGICKPPFVADCGTTGCETHKKCAGPLGGLLCVTPMKENENCGQDPYWVCEDGLHCEHGVCKPPVVNGCNVTGCPTGQKCAGTVGAFLCVTPMKENENCGQDPYWVCQDGYNCEGGVCKPPTPDDCTVTGCRAGTICAGSPGARQCVTPMKEGMQCDVDPYWVCDQTLTCRDFVCQPPGTPDIPRGGDCKPPGSICQTKLVCAGSKRMKCVRPMTEGRRCGQDPFWICRDDLWCVNGICRRSDDEAGPISRGGSCNFEGAVCEEGTKCVGTDRRKVCRRPKKLGKKCGTNPFRVCDDGLWCQNHRCVQD